MKITFGRCMNCGKRIEQSEFVCDRCYAIYFLRVKEVLDKKPDCSLDELKRKTELPTILLDKYYENGDIQKTSEISKQNRMIIQEEEEKAEEANKKVVIINELNKAFREKPKEPETENIKIVSAKMRFVGNKKR